MSTHILDPITVKYCKFKTNLKEFKEYKKISEGLTVCKRSFKDKECLNTVDQNNNIINK